MPETLLCRCGREVPPRHCPGCGSTNIYAKDINAKIVVLDGGIKSILRGFRCRRCALNFNEGMPCEAPEHASMQQKRMRDNVQTVLKDPELRKQALEKLFKKQPEEKSKWQETNPIFKDDDPNKPN